MDRVKLEVRSRDGGGAKMCGHSGPPERFPAVIYAAGSDGDGLSRSTRASCVPR